MGCGRSSPSIIPKYPKGERGLLNFLQILSLVKCLGNVRKPGVSVCSGDLIDKFTSIGCRLQPFHEITGADSALTAYPEVLG